MLYYDRAVLTEGIDVAKSNKSKGCIVCYYRFQDSVCNSYHDLTMLYFNLSDVAIITVKNMGYCCIIYNINKSNEIHLLQGSVLDNRRNM